MQEHKDVSVGLEDIKGLLFRAMQGSVTDVGHLRSALTAESRFQDAGIDSLDLVEFFVRLQERYKIAIPQEEYADLTSLDAVQRYVTMRLEVVARAEPA